MKKEKTTKAVAVALKGHYDLQQLDSMTAMATVLKGHIVKHNLYTNIKGKNYAHVEGWQFAGGLMGLFPRVVARENLSTGTEYKWLIQVDIFNIKTQQVVGTGYALCSSREGTKKSFDEYAILSMAQTRAIGKAYRNLIGWVMKLAGYEGTPSEEMHKVGEVVKEPVRVETEDENQTPIDYTCSKKGCGNEISKAEHDYSVKLYGKALCREHQKDAPKAK